MSPGAEDRCRTHQLITFEVVGRRYGVPMESLKAVVPLDSVHADWAEAGHSDESRKTRTARWRGKTLRVVDARDGCAGADGRVLIAVQCQRGPIGIAADRLESVVTYEVDQVDPTTASLPSPLGTVSTRVVDASGRTIDCVDLSALLET